MADVIRKATNRFTKGLVMDFSPENTKNELLTHALNATLLTFNGNELSLQNDMGNGRVETAYLPEGYMPVGTCEYGGIIYIVSYNPLEDKSQIGCFPSPERNISSDELGKSDVKIPRNNFQNFIKDASGKYFPDPNGKVLHNSYYALLKNDNLNPGDKFIVCSNKGIYDEKLADLWVDKDPQHYSGKPDMDPHDYELVSNPIIALNIVSIEDSGKIVYLNSDVRHYEKTNTFTKDGVTFTDVYKYHILGKMASGTNQLAQSDLDTYRNALSSGYSVFKSKTSGKLAILAELIMIDSYSVTHSLQPKKDEIGDIIEGAFDVIIHTEVSPEISKSNYNLVPKLKYYYLENSQGYIQISPDVEGKTQRPLFERSNPQDPTSSMVYNPSFFSTTLNTIYTPIDSDISNKLNKTLEESGKFNFPVQDTYHGQMKLLDDETTGGDVDSASYTKFTEGKFHRIDYSQVKNNDKYYFDNVQAKFYYYNAEGVVNEEFTEKVINTSYTYYVRKDDYIYHDVERNTKYQTGYELYKLYSEPITATETQIYDEKVEKFQYQETHTYKEATEADKASGEKLYYKDEDNKYVQLTGSPDETTTYYILKIENNLVSIGFEVNKDTTQGTIYYYPGTKTYIQVTQDEIDTYYNFEQYPLTSEPPYGAPLTLYWQEPNHVYVEATEHEINTYLDGNTKLYYSTNYIQLNRVDFDVFSNQGQLFIVVPIDIYIDENRFVPNVSYNYINGQPKPAGNYPKDDPIFVYTLEDFIPKEEPENSDLIQSDKGEYYSYKDLKLANITLPSVVTTSGLDLPFKYDYTLVPCMNYGKLEHLAVSNTIDFSKLHAFNQSNFHTWKYRIDNNQLRLTFGCDVYDTYETDKVDAIILEFYDCWGFAGSLEIVDKKSYSGVFTKIIPLNSFRALSRKKISGNAITERYKRNINLKEDGTIEGVGCPYTFNTEDPDAGWNIPDTNPKKPEEELNDCGTLYTNIVYGVKAYFRRTNKETKTQEYIKKKDFFLYTLPIYNDFYYTTQDFSNLTYPELEFVLTYKLKDTSTKEAYNGNGISGGYNETDKANIKDYLGGFCEAKSLDLIKYYKYTGTTDLYLEIGLKKDYEDLNLSYDAEINSKYNCKLQLFSDDSKDSTFTINSSLEGLVGANQILNYGVIEELKDENKVGFGDQFSTEPLPLTGIKSYNFINTDKELQQNSVKIKYQFVVGYTASIANIRDTQVQATTVCALFHKNPEEEFNYEDFGVYEHTTTEGGESTTKLLSNIMFYNEGTFQTEVFGICKQNGTTGTVSEQCTGITSTETEAKIIKTAGKLNTPDPLRQLVGHIGKLTFCQPHVHGFSEANGVNIHEGEYGSYYGIPPYTDMGDVGSSHEDTYGILPRDFMFKKPKYNLCLNTLDSIKYQSIFISTVDWKILQNKKIQGTNVDNGDNERAWREIPEMREFVGLTGEQLATFNEKLIKTMSSVYAYNPDYDSLTVNIGNITLQDYNPSFTSNLINIESSFKFGEGKTLNDFIYIGPMIYQTYLDKLYEHSKSKLKNGDDLIIIKKDGKVIPQLEFKENFDYCGTEENKYLISSLTYNTPVPTEIESELEFSASNVTVIKHTDGSNTFMYGAPNKKALYGYHQEYDKMIQLDVSNYTIEEDGTLKLSEESINTYANQSKEFDAEAIKQMAKGSYTFDHEITNEDGTTSKVRLGFYLTRESAGAFSSQLATSDTGFFMAAQSSYGMYDAKINLRPELYVISSDGNHKYSVKVNSITFQNSYAVLNDKVGVWDSDIPLYKQSYENLHKLTDYWAYPITLINRYDEPTEETYASDYWAFQDASSGPTFNGSWLSSDFDNTVAVDTYGQIEVNFNNGYIGMIVGSYIVGLLEIRPVSVEFTVTQSSKISVLPEQFVKTTRTNKYSEFKNNAYIIDSKYNNTRLKGSSITINDLIYEPNQQGHRLFLRNNLCTYNPKLRGKLYYRSLDLKDRSTWDVRANPNQEYINSLYLYTGPCFTPDTL